MPGGSGGSSPSGTTTVVQQANNAPWTTQQPYLSAGFQQAQNNYQSDPLNYYPGQTLANFDPSISQALTGMGNYGANGYGNTAGAGINNQAAALNQGTAAANGAYVDQNPATGGLLTIGNNNPTAGETGSLYQIGNAAGTTPYAASAAQIAGTLPQDTLPYVGALTNFGNQASTAGNGWGTLASNIADQQAGNPYGAGAVAASTLGLNNPYGGQANAAGQSAQANPYTPALGGVAGAAASQPYSALSLGLGDPAIQAAEGNLAATAGGAYLGSNPYLAGEFNAAAQPVINNYMTATAPQTDSQMEAAGRYGSGALANARSQNELNLGTTLGNMGANLYGQDYANERGLQTQAQSALGNLGLGNLAARTTQVGQAGSLANQGLSLAGNALGQAGALYNSGAQTAANAALGAGGLLNSAVGTAANTNLGAGSLMNQGLGLAANTALGAGNLTDQGLSIGGSLMGQAGNLNLNALSGAGNLLDQAQAQRTQGLATQAGAVTSAGQLQNAGVNTQMNALNALSNAYLGGGNLDLRGAMLSPSLSQMPTTDLNSLLSAGQGFTGMDQAQINAAMSQFYGNEMQPWMTNSAYMGQVGGPMGSSGSSSSTSPYFTNPLGNALGMGLGGVGLLGSINSLTGGGITSALGGLFGSGALSAPADIGGASALAQATAGLFGL